MYLALGGGPPGFQRDFPCPAVLRNPTQEVYLFLPTGLSPSMVGLSSTIQLRDRFSLPDSSIPESGWVLQPHLNNAYRLERPDGLGSFPFARRYLGSRGFFLLLGVLRCFTSPGYPLCPMNSDIGVAVLLATGCPIRVSPYLSLLAAPRGLSQLATPFIVNFRQGIHRIPLVAWSYYLTCFLKYP